MNERRSATLGLGKGQTTCRTPFQTGPGTAITSAVVDQQATGRRARRCQTARQWDGMGCAWNAQEEDKMAFGARP